MAKFTVETTYHLPIYRQRTYDADTLEAACRLAIANDDWSDQKEDHESAGATYVTNAWPGQDTAYKDSPFTIPSEFGETIQRQAEHFEALLGILKILAHESDGSEVDLAYWRARGTEAVAKAEAILVGDRDPQEPN